MCFFEDVRLVCLFSLCVNQKQLQFQHFHFLPTNQTFVLVLALIIPTLTLSILGAAKPKTLPFAVLFNRGMFFSFVSSLHEIAVYKPKNITALVDNERKSFLFINN